MTIEKAIALGLTGEKLSREITVDELANQSFSIERIALAYHEPALWERTTLNDRALIMLARANE
ncbi:MAG: hypothetical protein KBD39_04780 [Sterolibacterium sp.]|nr:hypothetical protein [Sterolibacterium sp.]MBP9799415.1 hypothetical protein [Sterolibacterium sp.]